jgi:2-polyprenyl-3-methyl-5-hydroxy-6-metoxy-1,4-benzoquinol methylase
MSAQPNRIDYRERLYAAYVSAHAARLRDIDWPTVRRDFALYDKVAGRFLPADRQVRILDLGCGFGGFIAYLRERGYFRAQGIDLSPEMVEAARRLRIEGVQRADIESFLARARGDYAFISAFDVIEHLHKQEVVDVLYLAHEALSADGTLMLWTPNAMSKYGRRCRSADFTHEHIFEANSIRQVLTATGFRRVEVLPLPPLVRGPASAVRWALWQIWEPLLKLSFAVESGWETGQVFTPNLIAVAQK